MIDVLTIVYNDFHRAGIWLLIIASIIFMISAVISNLFKWAPFRIIILLIAYAIISDILKQEVILFNLNLYIGLGMAYPHLQFVHILAYRIWYGILDFYEKLKDFLYAISRPFVFVYFQFVRLKAYYDARTEQKRYSSENEKTIKSSDKEVLMMITDVMSNNLIEEKNNHHHIKRMRINQVGIGENRTMKLHGGILMTHMWF